MNESYAADVLSIVRERVGFSQRFLARAEAIRAIAHCFSVSRCSSPAEYLRRLRGDPGLFAEVVNELTVSESYFMRDPALFEFVAREFFGSAARPERSLSMWSAGCAAGEELYSLAMVCKDRGHTAPLRLLGTDVSSVAVQRAEKAEYGRWSLRGLSEQLLARHFEALPSGRHRLRQGLRRHTSFQLHSLVSAFAPSFGAATFDLVLCRNVLIYIEPDRLAAAARTLSAALAPGALLITGPSDPALPLGLLPPPTATAFGLVYRARAADSQANDDERSGLRELAEIAQSLGALTQPDPLSLQPALASLATSIVANEAHKPETLPPPPQESGQHYFQAAAKSLEDGDDRAAEESLRKALYLEQDLALAHLLGAWLCKRRGDARGLRRAFERVLECLEGHPPQDEVPLGEGLTWGELERIARAELAPPTAKGAAR